MNKHLWLGDLFYANGCPIMDRYAFRTCSDGVVKIQLFNILLHHIQMFMTSDRIMVKIGTYVMFSLELTKDETVSSY